MICVCIRAMHHRGPDANSYYSDKEISLGHTLLATRSELIILFNRLLKVVQIGFCYLMVKSIIWMK